MKTRLVFQEGDQRLEIECPDGVMARRFLQRAVQPGYAQKTEIVREIEMRVSIDEILDTFNAGSDDFGRRVKDEAKVKLVRIPDPGSVTGRYSE